MGNTAKLTLWYEKQYGKLTITSGTQRFIVWHSSLLSPEALPLLGKAVGRLLAGNNDATCSWEEKSGQFRWCLERQGDNVAVTIRWFPEDFSQRPNEQGEIVFAARCPLRRLAIQVKNALLIEIEREPRDRYLPVVLADLDALLERGKRHRNGADIL